MAGVRKEPNANGKYGAWYYDARGRQKFFIGTTNRKETLRIAERLEDEHRQVKLGYRPAPKSADKHRTTPFDQVKDEYLSWGTSQGGRGGRKWSKDHAEKREYHLGWWAKRLKLNTLSDLDNILPKVEKELRRLGERGYAPKTLQNYRESLRAFCIWAIQRGYLAEDPLRFSLTYDTTPRTRRRALTRDEAMVFLQACRPKWRLLYATAICSGLRAGELRSLKVSHLDTAMGGLHLDAEWTKNRKQGFQYLPSILVAELSREAEGRKGTDPLLTVPVHTAKAFDRDLKLSGIEKHGPDGKLDFHSLRTTYVNLVLQNDVTTKEAMDMARHSTADLTLNVYGRSLIERRAKIAEKVGDDIDLAGDHVKSMPGRTTSDHPRADNSNDNK